MIILISAVSGTGKTLMAQKLLEKYHVPYLSMDHLKMGLYRGGWNCGFTPLDSIEVIGEKLWPVVKGIIMTNIENRQEIIIEGCYLLPHHPKDFDIWYSKRIIPVFMGFSADYIRDNFEAKIVKHRNAVEHRKWPEERTITELIEEHEEFKAKCLLAGVRYFEIDKDYENQMADVYSFIESERLRIGSL